MIKVGIFFGGKSREREISFTGGRTVFDRIDKSLFKPVPIFVDSLNNFILLKWEYLYKGIIRDFYPSHKKSFHFSEYIESNSQSQVEEEIKKIGKLINPHEFKSYFDFAFLCLNGKFGEDGTIQGLLEWYNIPYSGTRILGSAVNLNKHIQTPLINRSLKKNRPFVILKNEDWLKALQSNSSTESNDIFEHIVKKVGLPFVAKSCQQGSSIGVQVIDSKLEFMEKISKCFFILKLTKLHWQSLTDEQKEIFIINQIIDVRYGIGLPVICNKSFIKTAESLLYYLNMHFETNEASLLIESCHSESEIIIEPHIKGREFSCIVIEDKNHKPFALPLTEIYHPNPNKNSQIFDYRSKYLPGAVNKKTPMEISLDQFKKIKYECEKLFTDLYCNIYARIDGFLTEENDIILNDPNTTSGMNPPSFLFHQAAEVGFTPTKFLTYIISQSLHNFQRSYNDILDNTILSESISENLEKSIYELKTRNNQKIKIGVLLGGFSSERHVSFESGRNVFEKLHASQEYEPIPIFLSGNREKHELYIIPINLLLKDNVDDINKEILDHNHTNEILAYVRSNIRNTVTKYEDKLSFQIEKIEYSTLKKHIEFMFIALHGRPGEDGQIQKILEKYDIPYNGSKPSVCKLTMDKYATNQFLNSKGILTAKQKLIIRTKWRAKPNEIIKEIEEEIKYPLITKPVDEGCSTGVYRINNREQLQEYFELTFRLNNLLNHDLINHFQKYRNNEFPTMDKILIEPLVEKGKAKHFLEITVGLLTKRIENKIDYIIFDPSETITSNAILSLEEKFLAGEGQNITPPKYSKDAEKNLKISQFVKGYILKVAKILSLEGYARVDAFVKIYEHEVKVYIIEVNTLPAMTPATCIFQQSCLAGYSPYEFIKAIIEYGISKKKIKKEIM